MELVSGKDGDLDVSLSHSVDGIFLTNGISTPNTSLTGSLDSLFSTDYIEELDSEEFGLPDADNEREPSLQEALRCSPPPIEEWLADKMPPLQDEESSNPKRNETSTGAAGKALYLETVHGVSRQLHEAEHRGGAGAAVSLAVWRAAGAAEVDVRVAAGTLHGRILAWRGASLRWATAQVGEGEGAVTALAWRQDGQRILACFARGAAMELDASAGRVMRRISLPVSPLSVSWAGLTAAVLLDSLGAAHLLRCTRLFGSRSLKSSRLPGCESDPALSAAPLQMRAVAIATTKRILLLCGSHACSVSLRGQVDFMPLLCWRGTTDNPVLVSARGTLVQMHSALLTKQKPQLTLLKSVQLMSSPLLWLGDLDEKLLLMDCDERIYHFDDADEPEDHLDLSPISIVYTSPFYKGIWSEREQSVAAKAVSSAGRAAMQSAVAATTGILLVLGRSGVGRIRRRDAAARAAVGCFAGALRSALSEGPQVARHQLHSALQAAALHDLHTTKAAVRLSLQYGFMEELWGDVWRCGGGGAIAVQLAERDSLPPAWAPPPALLHDLLTLMVREKGNAAAAKFAQIVAGAWPLCASAALHWCQSQGLWEVSVGVCAASGNPGAPLRHLAPLVCHSQCCQPECCPGAALLKHATKALASEKHADRYEALDALLRDATDTNAYSPMQPPAEEVSVGALLALLRHNTAGSLQLLRAALQAPPFLGPLGRHNRQRLLRALMDCCQKLQAKCTIEILEFVHKKITDGILLSDSEYEKVNKEIIQKLIEDENTEEVIKKRLQNVANRESTLTREDTPEEETQPQQDSQEESLEEGEEGLRGVQARLECARAASRVAAKEAFSQLALSIHAASRALACGAICLRCRRPLAGSRAHAAWCGHAWHASCDPGGPPPPVCVRCSQSWPLTNLSPNILAAKMQTATQNAHFNLCLTAPPRPDLEGIL